MVIPFHPSHLDAPGFSEEVRGYIEAGRQAMEGLAADGRASTVVAAGVVLAVCGAVERAQWKNGAECEVFVFATDALRRHPVTAWKGLTRELGRIKKRYGRIWALGADTEISRRFLSRLGFGLDADTRKAMREMKLVWRLE